LNIQKDNNPLNFRWITIAFFIAYFILGVSIFSGYGISWDEPIQRYYGNIVYDYTFQGDTTLLQDRHRYYGPIVEFTNIVLEKAFHLTDIRSIFLLRHFTNFCIYFLGVVFFYLLTKKIFNNRFWGLLASSFFIISPRLFAHSFFNSKDIPFTAFFIIAIFTLLLFTEKPTFSRTFWHSLTSALLIDTRVLGLIIVFITASIIFYKVIINVINNGYKNNIEYIKKHLIYFLIYISIFIFFTVLFWPILWKDSVFHFIKALENMSHYPWHGDVLYLGSFVSSLNLPWHYIPTWIGITTPPTYLFLFFIGVIGIIKDIAFSIPKYLSPNILKQKIHSYPNNIAKLTTIIWVFVPLIAIITLKSVLYDSWRHLFFIYPGIIIIAIMGLLKIKEWISNSSNKHKQILWYTLIALISINLISTIYFMVRYHPYQNVYFNKLAGPSSTLRQRFELDYWGTSYRKGLEHILSVDNRAKIPILPDLDPGISNSYILKVKDRKRLQYVKSIQEANYFITNFRWHPQDFMFTEIFSVKVKNTTILSVYHNPQPSTP
jgi:hypothetical protein